MTDPAILREDINDLRWASEQGDEQMYWHVNTEKEMLQNQINTLETKVMTLEGQINQLNRWKANSETWLGSLEKKIAENYSKFNIYLHEINNHAMNLDHVVLEHHPDNYRELGYTLHEKTDVSSASGELPEVPSTTPTST